MKIDVEGYEYEVLKGGKELITKFHVPYIFIEFNFLIFLYSNKFLDFMSFLISLNFSIKFNDFKSSGLIGKISKIFNILLHWL